MVETEFDLNALPEQLLLGQALTLVTDLCKSRRAAERILRQHLDRFCHPSIRWTSQLQLPSGCSGAAMRLVVWRPDDDARLEVDWDAHSAVYIGRLPSQLGKTPDDPEDRWPIFLPDSPVGQVEAHLIRLQRDDVIAVLRYLRLLPSVRGVLAAPAVVDAASISAAPAVSTAAAEPKLKPGSASQPARPQPKSKSSWLAEARERYPRQPGEAVKDYSERLHPHMVAAHSRNEVMGVWEPSTIGRRLYDRE